MIWAFLWFFFRLDVGPPRICFRMEPAPLGQAHCLAGANPFFGITIAVLAIILCFLAACFWTKFGVRQWNMTEFNGIRYHNISSVQHCMAAFLPCYRFLAFVSILNTQPARNHCSCIASRWEVTSKSLRYSCLARKCLKCLFAVLKRSESWLRWVCNPAFYGWRLEAELKKHVAELRSDQAHGLEWPKTRASRMSPRCCLAILNSGVLLLSFQKGLRERHVVSCGLHANFCCSAESSDSAESHSLLVCFRGFSWQGRIEKALKHGRLLGQGGQGCCLGRFSFPTATNWEIWSILDTQLISTPSCIWNPKFFWLQVQAIGRWNGWSGRCCWR